MGTGDCQGILLGCCGVAYDGLSSHASGVAVLLVFHVTEAGPISSGTVVAGH